MPIVPASLHNDPLSLHRHADTITTYCNPVQGTVSAVTQDTAKNLLHLDMLLSELAFDMVEILIVHEITRH